MSIMFDDQGPITPSVRAKRIEERSFSFEKLLMRWGVAKTKKQASVLTVVLGVSIIFICGIVTLSAVRQEPIDDRYYYDPSIHYDG